MKEKSRLGRREESISYSLNTRKIMNIKSSLCFHYVANPICHYKSEQNDKRKY